MIDRDDLERLKEIFVTRQECQSITDQLDQTINNDNVRLAIIEQQNKLILWILAAIGSGVITMLVKMFFS